MYKYRGYLVVLGAFLMHLSLGTVYTYANISTYLGSYLHYYNNVYFPKFLEYNIC